MRCYHMALEFLSSAKGLVATWTVESVHYGPKMTAASMSLPPASRNCWMSGTATRKSRAKFIQVTSIASRRMYSCLCCRVLARLTALG